MKKNRWLTLFLIPLTLVSPVQADMMEMENAFFAELPTVVTASKREESQLSAPGTVYVITEEDIRRYGWRNMQEALSSIPNLDFVNNYNWMAGGQRGFTGNSSGTLLLLNGREIQNLTADEAFMTTGWSLNRVSRIEVLQGPNSTLFGANAMQGIYNIITKTGDGQPDTQEIHTMFGGAGTSEYSFLLKKNNPEGFSIGADGTIFKTARNWNRLAHFVMDDKNYSRSAIDSTRNHDPRAFNNAETDELLDLHVRYKNVYGGLNYWHTNSGTGIEGVDVDYRFSDVNRNLKLFYVGADRQFTDRLKGVFEYRHQLNVDPFVQLLTVSTRTITTYTDYREYERIARATVAPKERRTLTAQVDYKLNDWNSFVTGVDFRFYHLHGRRRPRGSLRVLTESDPFGGAADTWTEAHGKTIERSYFIQDTIPLMAEKLKFTGGLMFHTRNYVKDTWLPRASLVFQPQPSSAVKLTYGKGFRSPSSFELESTITNAFLIASVGGSELTPAKMEMYELNYTHAKWLKSGQYTNILALYKMTASNTINTGSNITSPASFLPKFSVEGVEDSLRYKINKLNGMLGFRFVNPDKTRVAGQDVKINVPLMKVKAGVSYDVFSHLTASVFADHFSAVKKEARPWNDATNSAITNQSIVYEVPAWTAVNLNLLMKEVGLGGTKGEISFYVENLFNTTYYHANHREISPLQYLQPERNYRVSLNVKI